MLYQFLASEFEGSESYLVEPFPDQLGSIWYHSEPSKSPILKTSKIVERKFEISTLMNFHETLEIKCNFQRPSSSDSPLKMITVLQLVVLAFPTGRDSANFRDKGTEVLSLSQDKGTMGQAKYLANGRDEVQNGTKQKRTFQNRKWMSQNKKGHSKTGKNVPKQEIKGKK